MLDKNDVARAAANGFHTHRARARVGVEKSGALHARAENVKQSLAQLVRGGTQIPAL